MVMALGFIDWIFIIFMLIFLIGYWIFQNSPKNQQLWLFIGCVFFCGFGNLISLFFIFVYITINYLGGMFLAKLILKKKKIFLIFLIIINLSFLGVFKYFNFIESIMHYIFPSILQNSTATRIYGDVIIPIGYSFFILQGISYCADIFLERTKVCRNFISFAIYLIYFPKMLSGPLERSETFLSQLRLKKKISSIKLGKSFQLILVGYFKKMVCSNIIINQISNISENPSLFNPTIIFLTTILFPLYLYADFSGYTDIARGISLLLGINLTINFKQPYLSTNIQAIWRKWHISLTQWFRDYVYIPLKGNRKSSGRTMINITIVMILSGIWHGIGINYILWGGINSLYLIVYRIIKGRIRPAEEEIKNLNMITKIKVSPLEIIPTTNSKLKYVNFVKNLGGFLITQSFWAVSLIFFQTSTIKKALYMLRSLFFIDLSTQLDLMGLFMIKTFIFFGFILCFLDVLNYLFRSDAAILKLPWIFQGIIYFILLLSLILLQTPEFQGLFLYEGF